MSSASALTAPDLNPSQSRLIEAKEAWSRTVERYHLDQQHVTLGQINTPRPKRFSGSTIDERAYAFLRLLRPSPQRWALSGVLEHLSRRRLVDRSREEAFRRYFGCSMSSPAPAPAPTPASVISALPVTPDARDAAAAAAAAAATSMRFNRPALLPAGQYERCTADGTLRILNNLIRLIEDASIDESDLPATFLDYPHRYRPSSSTLAEHLGGFSSFWASLSTSEPSIRNSRTSSLSLVPELSAASSRLDFQSEAETIAPTTPRFTDSPPSPIEDLDSLLRRTNINATTPSKPPLFPSTTPASFSSSDTDSDSDSDSDSEIGSGSTPMMPLPEDNRVRTSTESERMDLFNAFVNGCMTSIQLAGGSKSAVWCTTTSSQVRFQFGEAGKRSKTRTDTSMSEDVLNASFVACVDGVQYARPPLFGPQQQQQQQRRAGIPKPEHLALIEAKNRGREAKHPGLESVGINAVRRQEGAELVACIYEDREARLKRAALASLSDPPQTQLLYSVAEDGVYLSIAEFSLPWLQYIDNPTSPVVPPGSPNGKDAQSEDWLIVWEYGPLDFRRTGRDCKELALVIAMLVDQEMKS
ncbi:hypothetical protein LZ554_004344 [Drepanopeziza brunnea f. sp. 'monogermtubi']|nr:hypothetical protein LZ554_004344 [Drepanopeziza brunnea f. sp. 'monogermtubi']